MRQSSRRNSETHRREGSKQRHPPGHWPPFSLRKALKSRLLAGTRRCQKMLYEAVAELEPNARGYRADVTVTDNRRRLFADLAKDFGKLDIVFAYAGRFGTGDSNAPVPRHAGAGEMTILLSIVFPRFQQRSAKTADPSTARRDRSAPPDFLSKVAASVGCMWFSLRRTTYVVAGKGRDGGNPGTLLMNKMCPEIETVVSGDK